MFQLLSCTFLQILFDRSTNYWPKELHRDYNFEFSEKIPHTEERKWSTSFWTQFKVLMQRNLIQSAKSQLSIQEIVLVCISLLNSSKFLIFQTDMC